MKSKKWYMAVTADAYENVLGLEPTAAQLERTMSLPRGTVIATMSKNGSGRNTGMKFVRVQI